MRLIFSALLAAHAAPPAAVSAPALSPAATAAPAVPGIPAALPPAPVPALAPAPAPTSAASALASMAVDALSGPPRPVPSTESFLREELEYNPVVKRPTLFDGAVVAADAPGLTPDRVSLDHPGVRRFAAGARTADDVRARVRAAAARPGAALAARALSGRRARQTRAVELGEALDAGAVDARRLALAAHMALKDAGLAPKLARLQTAGGARLVNLLHADGGQTVFAPLDPALDGRKLSELTASGAATETDAPRVFNPGGKAKAAVEARVPELPPFAVLGRSAAERDFKQDAQRLAAAAPDEAVRVEWLFLPFYVDGHSVLRVGDQVYEYRRAGWRVQNARAYLFNNPYFDAQYARHRSEGMPPFSLGLTLSVSKRAADALVARIEAERTKAWPRFSFWFNNCNQRPLKFLRAAGVVGLPDGLFTRFSSIRSFRLLLTAPPLTAGRARLYPLPGRAGPLEPYGPAIPRELRVPRPGWLDALAFVRLWPRFFSDKLALLKRLPKG